MTGYKVLRRTFTRSGEFSFLYLNLNGVPTNIQLMNSLTLGLERENVLRRLLSSLLNEIVEIENDGKSWRAFELSKICAFIFHHERTWDSTNRCQMKDDIHSVSIEKTPFLYV